MFPHCDSVGCPVTELTTPALLLHLDKLDQNIALMRRVIIDEAHVGWRPHTKAIKIPAVAHHLIRHGALGVTCAKLGEAEVMAAAGIRDILIANQVVGNSKLARLMGLLHHADVIVAVDSMDHLETLDAAAQRVGAEPRVVIEVDLGIRRSGLPPGEPVVRLAKAAAARRGLRFAGVMGWEGHTAGIPDPGQKRKAIEAAVGQLTASADLCRAAGLPVEIVSCGGTGTYWITARMPGVTEVQAGGGVFGDVHYRQDFGVQHEHALTILTTVISRPTPTRIVCDAGWKAMGQLHRLPEPQGLGPIASLKLTAEHATIELESPQACPRIGDAVEFVAGYSDATVFLHDHIYGIRHGSVEVVWPILGRGKLQ